MSDDRMDRAERIRNMREGNRSTDEETADESATDPDATDDEPETASPDTGQTTTTVDEAATANTGSEATPTGTAESTGPPTTSTTETQTTEPSPDEASGTDHGTADDDATAAAQRAAASAAEVMGEGDGIPDAETLAENPAGGDSTAAGGDIPQAPSGVELPDQQLLEEAMASSTVTSTEGGARSAAMEGGTGQTEELVRVLEFSLGDEYYCLDIEYVEEIVKRSAVTRVPNTPEFVDGVVDLRGQITTILEPKEMMDIEAEGDQNLIIVFDPDKFEEQGAVGWVVDEVRQVVPVTETEVNSPPVDADYINGVIDREEYDQFVIWVEPDDALERATSTEEE